MVRKWQAIRPPGRMMLRSTLSSNQAARGGDQRSPPDKRTAASLNASEFTINKSGWHSLKPTWAWGWVEEFRQIVFFSPAIFEWWMHLIKKQSFVLDSCGSCVVSVSDLQDVQTAGRSHPGTEAEPSVHRRDRRRTDKKESKRKMGNLSELSL